MGERWGGIGQGGMPANWVGEQVIEPTQEMWDRLMKTVQEGIAKMLTPKGKDANK